MHGGRDGRGRPPGDARGYGADHRAGGRGEHRGGSRGEHRGGSRGEYRGGGRGEHGGSVRGDYRGSFGGGGGRGGGFRGDRSQSGGRGGGSGGGGGKVTTAVYELPVQLSTEILKQTSFLWHADKLDANSASALVPPPAKGPGTLAPRRIPLITNNLPLRSFKPTDTILTYSVDIDLSQEDKAAEAERKKKPSASKGKSSPRRGGPTGGAPGEKDPPKPKLWKKIVKHILPVIENENGKKYVATDYSKSIYATFKLELRDEYRVSLRDLPPEDGEGNSRRTYVVKITDAGMPMPTAPFAPYLADMYKAFFVDQNPVPEDLLNFERVLNIALKTTLNKSLVPVGRFSFYKEPLNEDQDLGGGLVNWAGFSTVLTMGWKTFVNVDIANTGFVKGQRVYDALKSLFYDTKSRAAPDNAKSLQSWDLKDALKLLKGVLVEYETNPKLKSKICGRITGILQTTAKQNEFTTSDGKVTNVEEYFKKQYQINLQFPNGLCLLLKGKSVVPAELCTIRKGQAYNAKLSEGQTSKMIKITAVPPKTRLEMIQQHVRENKFEQDPVLKTFGVTVDTNLHQQEARVLPPPKLVYADKSQTTQHKQIWLTPPNDGVWNMGNFQFVIPATGFTWSVINADRLERGYVSNFVKSLCDTAKSNGVDMGDADGVMKNYTPIKDSKEVLEALKRLAKNGIKMALVIVPRKDKTMYGIIKTASEIMIKEYNILTQVILAKNVSDSKPSLVQNLLLKINMKLGGTNYYMHTNFEAAKENPWARIDILRAPVLIIGADVTHPGFDSKFPSFAAVTGSINRTGMPFQMHIQAQRRAERGAAEVIEGLSAIIQEFIRVFVFNTGHKPRKIIYYRDGVGDGQFGEVLRTEMMAIRDGCTEVGNLKKFHERCVNDTKLGESMGPGKYKPRITFVAVQKRHKVRFFPKNPSDGVGRMANAPPGTVVDTDIVKPIITDFYLLSHAGIQGTSRPTRYQVLWDDSDFNANELELLTYYLCYMYCRCTRSVSYPAPTYYAHLGATRAKAYGELLDDNTLADINAVNQRINRSAEFQNAFRMHFV